LFNDQCHNQVKNDDQQFWKKKFHVANGKAQHALMMGPCFFFGGRGVGWGELLLLLFPWLILA